jgi:hypothetical protein
MTERTNPRRAKASFGRVAAAGTLAALAGAFAAALVSDAFGVGAMLPVLATLNLTVAWCVRGLAREPDPPPVSGTVEETPGVLTAKDAATLAAVILLTTVSSTLAEQLMNVQARATLAPDALPRFFSAYYAGVSIFAFIVQAAFASRALTRFGLGLAMSSPSLVVGAGGVGALLYPGFVLVTAAYGSMSVLYEALFRPARDVFFTSVPKAEQRRVKSLVEVAPNRVGALAGAALIGLTARWWADGLYAALLLVAIACAAAAAVLAARLTSAYVGNLERSLTSRSLELDLADVDNLTTRTVMLRALTRQPGLRPGASTTGPAAVAVAEVAIDDPHLRDIQVLRSRDPERIRAVLRAAHGVGALIQYVIPLLTWDAVAEDAVRALRMAAEEHIGALVDALLDPNQPFAVRRRLARVFSVCVSQRAVDGLLIGLDDVRFEVRYQCGRSLSSILEKNASIRIDRERILDTVRREISVGKAVWDSHRLLDEVPREEESFVDGFVGDRARQGLAHVFALLSLVLPTEPLQIAYRGLHIRDLDLQDIALEYIEAVLPPDVYGRLSPFIDVTPRAPGPRRSRDEILAELLRSQDRSQLEELRRRTRK